MNFNRIKQKNILRIFSLSLFIFIVLWFYPISYGFIRLAILVLAGLIYVSFLYLVRKSKIVCSITISLLLIFTLLLALPGKAINTDSLKTKYIFQLNKYNNTNYIWGGENRVGIDCSGLVRKGLIIASFQEGLLTLNSDLIKTSFDLWWHDSSAEALRDEYRNYTKKLYLSESINSIDYQKINSGDLAVTKDGVHILAYLGEKIWIEADPIYKKVIKVKIPEIDNPWFSTAVYVLRWQKLIQ